MKDTDLVNIEAVEGRATDRSDTQIGQAEQANAQFNSAGPRR